MDPLATLDIHGPTTAGWDYNTPPNEKVDEFGRAATGTSFGDGDPRAPTERRRDAPSVETLRESLRESNGIRGLELVTPHEVDRAVALYRRDGFVVVVNALDEDALARFRGVCAKYLAELLRIPGHNGRRYMAETGRLAHRYCYGTTSASRQMMHDPTWASMIDLPTTTPILKAIFASDDYVVWGGGGDLSLPGAIEYQHLHTDGIDPRDHPDRRLEALRRQRPDQDLGDVFAALSVEEQRLVMDRTPPGVTINFTMSDLTWENGPIRQIPGTHTTSERPPRLADEPAWMRLSTLVGAPAGSAIFRDTRAWHGATPNLSNEIRALPSVEYSAPWRADGDFAQSMPDEIWQRLTPHAQHVCRRIRAPAGQWPFGAGFMHPLAAERFQVYADAAKEAGTVRMVHTDPASAGTAIRLLHSNR